MNVYLFSSSLSLPYRVLIVFNKFEGNIHTHIFVCGCVQYTLYRESGLRVIQADSLITVESTRHSNQ